MRLRMNERSAHSGAGMCVLTALPSWWTPEGAMVGSFPAADLSTNQESYCKPASELVPTARVPFPSIEIAGSPRVLEPVAPVSAQCRNRFLLICKTYLKRSTGAHSGCLDQWYTNNLSECDSVVAAAFLDELAASCGRHAHRKRTPG